MSRTYLLIYHYRIDGHCDHPSGKINSKRKFRMRCNSGEASYRLGVLHKRWADSGRLVFEVLTNFLRTHDLGDWVLMGEYLYYSGNPPPPLHTHTQHHTTCPMWSSQPSKDHKGSTNT